MDRLSLMSACTCIEVIHRHLPRSFGAELQRTRLILVLVGVVVLVLSGLYAMNRLYAYRPASTYQHFLARNQFLRPTSLALLTTAGRKAVRASIEPSAVRANSKAANLVDLLLSRTAIAHHPAVHLSCHSTRRSVSLRSAHISTQWPLLPTQRSLTSRAPSPGLRSASPSSRAGCRARLALRTQRRRASG